MHFEDIFGSRFSSNSEVNDSELLENPEDMTENRL